MYEQQSGSISMPMLIILVSWLTALFISFGLMPANGTVVASLLVSAPSVSAATFLILEIYSPHHALIKISRVMLRSALTQLGN
jgi:hypothetical protein